MPDLAGLNLEVHPPPPWLRVWAPIKSLCKPSQIMYVAQTLKYQGRIAQASPSLPLPSHFGRENTALPSGVLLSKKLCHLLLKIQSVDQDFF